MLAANYESAERRLDRVIAETATSEDTDSTANESADVGVKKRIRRYFVNPAGSIVSKCNFTL